MAALLGPAAEKMSQKQCIIHSSVDTKVLLFSEKSWRKFSVCARRWRDISDTDERDLVIKAATRLELELSDSDVDTRDEDETLSRDLSRQVMSNNTLF